MADHTGGVIVGADLGSWIGLIHDVAKDNAAFFMRAAGVMSGRHEALVVIALNPDGVMRAGHVRQCLPVLRRHPAPGSAIMEHITKKQQPPWHQIGNDPGKPRQRLRRVVRRQELP